ncbi:MAG: RNA polymerase sigma factor RpoD, partial [Hyphomicrobiaceae bacterium]|nr:RNA polymerase sigma factor RpoD [Hyphomicrobiaceae bacterium]
MARAAQQSTKPVAQDAPPPTEAPERDAPVLDLTDAGVKKLIKAGKAAGYVTYDQLNAALPAEMTASEQIEDTLAMLNDMGIIVVEG